MTVTWQHEAAVVVGFRSARACWTGQWPQPLSHGMESPCRLSYVSHSSQSFPNLPFLVFSNFPILLVIFFCLLGPFRLPAVRVTLLPPSSSSFRQLQLFQWIDHNVFVTSYSPATRTSFASFTPSVNAPGDQRGRGMRCFHLPGAPRHTTAIHHRLRR